jgi:hypothetical protein
MKTTNAGRLMAGIVINVLGLIAAVDSVLIYAGAH